MKKSRKILAVIIAAIVAFTAANVPVIARGGTQQRYMEKLDRGLVAMKVDSGIYLTWRLLGTEAYNTTFDVYRDGTKIVTAVSDSTNYFDADGTISSVYKVVPTGESIAGAKEATAFATGTNYLEIPVAPLSDYTHGDQGYPYKIHDASVGDLDGDGEYEIVVKREANHQHAGAVGFNHMYLEAYKLDGTVLWRIDMGQNMRAMTEFVFLVYDFNEDGAAEIACKTAPGTIDATGAYITSASLDTKIQNADNSADYHDGNGYILKGPEYFTLFDGRNGQALDTIEYPILRGTDANNTLTSTASIWGDGYGHREEKCMGTVSYFDGVNPGIAVWRGIYTRIAAANISINKNTNRMSVGARFDTESGFPGYQNGYKKYEDQGNHSIACGDVDNDGKDEVISGGLCLDDDMTPLWCTYREHGDAHHLAEYDPTNNSLEYLTVHEHGGDAKRTTDFGDEINLDFGMTLTHASDGKELYHAAGEKDTGRGVMANLGMGGYYQFWGTAIQSSYGKTNDYDNDPTTDSSAVGASDTYNFQPAGHNAASSNFRIFWDGDLYDELFDCMDTGSLDFRPRISKYNRATGNNETIFQSDDTRTINHTKAAPLLQADIFGDWREELVLKTSDDMAMRIYTTNIPTTHKLYTLMHDSLYRQGVALQNQYYNQPPHIGYYVCEDSDTLYNADYDKRDVQPNIQTVDYSAAAPQVTAKPVSLIPTERDSSAVIHEDGDFYLGVGDVTPSGGYWTSTQDGVGRQLLVSTTTATSYLQAAATKTRVKNNAGRFLLFSAAGADSDFKTTSEQSVNGAGKLNFSFSYPLTYSDNGSFAYGNSPASVYVGDGTNTALKFTVTPNLVRSFVRSATLSVNGTNICSFDTGAKAQEWSEVECILDGANKKATVIIKKADGNIYRAQVDYLDINCGSLNTFGVKADGDYGTILLDEIKLYATDTVEEPSATATATYSPVSVVPTVTNQTHFYQFDASDLISGTITKMIPVTGSISEANSYSTGDFGTDTLKLAHINALDGWGYIHKAFDTDPKGRQTGAGLDADNNSITLNGTVNVGGGVLSFIPKNVAGLEMPTTGTMTYKFTAAISGKDGSRKSGSTVITVPVEAEYGFTTSDDGSTLETVGNFNLNRTDGVEVVMTYDIGTKEYSVTVDGEVKSTGTSSKAITGIYNKSKMYSYTYSSIKNLVVDTDSYTPPPAVDPIPMTTSTLYTENVSGITSEQITNKIKTTETMEELNLYCVSDFKDGNSRTTAIPALDGWGYVHCAYDNSSNQDRQTKAEANVSNNTVTIVSTSNVAGGAITFIPQNVDDLEIPGVGKITYSFKAVVSGGDITYGFTSSSDGAVVSSVASTVISSATKNVVMTYDKYTNEYSISVDGETVASGTANRITGIYASSSKSWATGSIKDLVVSCQSYDAPSIESATISDIADVTYDGRAQKPSFTVTLDGTVLTPNTDYVAEYSNNTNAGTATITVTGIGIYQGTATKNFNILKINGTATVTADDIVYGGALSVTPVSATNGVDNVTYQYKVKGADDSTYTNTAPTNAGEYTVKATFAATTNYNTATATDDFRISPANGTATVTADDIVYGGALSVTPVSATNGVGNVTYLYKVKGDDDSTYTNTAPTNAGEYTVKATFAATTNYNTATATDDFRISPANGTATVTADDIVYGGALSVTPVSATNEVDNVTYQYKVKGADDSTYTNTAPTNAGEYTVKAIFAATTNYNTATATDDFKISPKVVTLTWENTSFTYDGENHAPTATVSNLVGGDSCAVTVTGETNTAGNHTATATALSNANYTLNGTANTTQAFTITASAEPTATPTAVPTATPTAEPTPTPTVVPTATPTAVPTATPTVVPTATPTVEPTATPTAEPTAVPTTEPTVAPTTEPTAEPTAAPTTAPTEKPVTKIQPIGKYKNMVEVSEETAEGKVKLTITKTADNAGTLPQIDMFMAEYDNGKLVGLKPCSVVYDESTNTVTATCDIPTSAEFKLMLWDKDLSPIIDTIRNITQ